MLLASAQETRLQLRIKARLSAFFMLQVGHGFKPCRRKNFGGVLNPALQEKIRQAGGLPPKNSEGSAPAEPKFGVLGVGLLPDRGENRLNVGRGFTPRR